MSALYQPGRHGGSVPTDDERVILGRRVCSPPLALRPGTQYQTDGFFVKLGFFIKPTWPTSAQGVEDTPPKGSVLYERKTVSIGRILCRGAVF